MNTMHNLLSYYNNTTEDDIFHITLGTILNNWEQIEHSTINDVCTMCSVSPATISRLAKKLGFKNFTEFKHEIVSIWNNYSFYNRVLPVALSHNPNLIVSSYINTMRQMLNTIEETIDFDKIHQIVDGLHAAKRVRFYSYGKYYAEAPLQINLMRNGKDVLILVRHMDQLCDAKKLDDTSIVVIYAGESIDSMDMEPILKKACDRKAKVLLFTSPNTPFKKYADYTISTELESVKTMMSANIINIYLDIINTFYRSKYIDKFFDE
jgi:DNA-binding MurR/RpiR family transcriptional regulator